MKKSSFLFFYSVVYALFLREIQTRFGSRKMGYFWAIAEPVAFISVFSGIKVLLFNRTMPGIDFIVFVASGFIVFFLFRNILTTAMNAFESNRALFVYAQVKPIHTIISRVLVEFLISSCVFTLFFFIGWYLGFDIYIKDLYMFLLCVLWIQVFGLGIGLLIAVIGTFYETVKKIVKIILSPLMFLSAIFYTVDSLPPTLRELILYNPVAHFMELLHGSYFHGLDTNYVDYLYMMYWTIVPLFFGLYLYIKTERKIQAT